MIIHKFDYNNIPGISSKDLRYIELDDSLTDFYAWKPELKNLERVIKAKQNHIQDRNVICDILEKQYKDRLNTKLQLEQITKLRDQNTFTIITAHQPSLLTGPLYYIIKILSAIKLTEMAKKAFPKYHFVPLFLSGGEDHDFEEMNHLELYGKKIEWNSEEFNGGSVGQLGLQGVEDAINDVIQVLGDTNISGKWLQDLKKSSVMDAKSYGEFALRLTHEIFADYGLLVFNMDSSELKQLFSEVILQEVIHHTSKTKVTESQGRLENHNWKSQAFARDINFFYRKDGQRLRIEKTDNNFQLVDSNQTWSKDEMMSEIKTNAGSFSPNVIMRPLFQEWFIPNIAYVGGGGEIAYWLERKTQFEEYHIPFPMLIRRSSLGIIEGGTKKNINKLNSEIQFFLQDEHQMVKKFLELKDYDMKLDKEKEEIQNQIQSIAKIAKSVDQSLEKYSLAEGAKIQKMLDNVESKIRKAIKKKEETEINKLSKVRSQLFPGGSLQERKHNILQYVNTHDWTLLDKMYEAIDPFERKFVFLEL